MTSQATITSGSARPVANLAPVPVGLDEPCGAQDRQVLRGVRLARAELGREAADLERAVREPVEDLEPAWAREDLQRSLPGAW